MNIGELIRPHLRSFKPYTSARSEVNSAELLLDANEITLGSPVAYDGVALNRYPDPFQVALRSKLAGMLEVPVQSVFVGAGSDEIIDLLIRLLCDPGKDAVAVLEPTYGVYSVAAAVNNVATVVIDLNNDFDFKATEVAASLPANTKLLFLCSPNNPTGNLLNREEILTLCESTSAIVVVDQAYAEFTEVESSLSSFVAGHKNLVVLKTLSKAWGLAGIRLGYCVANPDVVSYLMRIKSPYNISASTARLALNALDNPAFLQNSVRIVRGERDRLVRALSALDVVEEVFPSEANFLLVRFRNAENVYRHLLNNGIVVRRRSEPRLAQCLRITIGTPDENDVLLRRLKECA